MQWTGQVVASAQPTALLEQVDWGLARALLAEATSAHGPQAAAPAQAGQQQQSAAVPLQEGRSTTSPQLQQGIEACLATPLSPFARLTGHLLSWLLTKWGG